MGNKFIRAAFAGLLLGFVAATAAAQVNVSVSYFHDTLAPHGRWVASSSYGDVWVPGGVAAGWSPYVDGEWQWTDYGWTWASSDPWGDVAYHYGTWVYSPPYGWVWVPGTVWAPAWVTWAYTDDYIGWAPVPVSFALSAHGYAGPAVVATRTSYVFVPARQFTGVRVASVRVPAAQVPTIYAHAHRATAFPVTGGIVHNTGLPVARVEKVTGRKVEVVRAAPERLRPAPVPQGKSASYTVVAPKSERAAAMRQQEHGGSQPARSADAAAAEHDKKNAPAGTHSTHSAATQARPAPAESHDAQGHEPKPKKEPVQARPAPAEPNAHAAKGHEAKPKHEPAPKAAPEAQAAPQEQAPREAASVPPHAAQPHDAQPKSAAHPSSPHPEQKAQHGNPNAKPAQSGNPHDKDGPGKPKN